MAANSTETFEQAIERCLMDGTTAAALRVMAADFDDASKDFIEAAALRQGADGLDTLVARLATVQRERDEARETLRHLVRSLDDLIAESEGVYGLHLNGDPAPWDSLTEGGRFEQWLIELNRSRTLLARYDAAK